MKDLERRREKRIKCVLGIIEVNGQPSPNAYLLDISSLGAQFETNCPITVGESVVLGLFLPAEKPEDREEVYHLTGQASWFKNAEDIPERYLIGLSFFTPFKETGKIIERFRYQLILDNELI